MAAWALVTGGSSGIGLEFARLLAQRGYNLVLVAQDRKRLAAAQAELKGTGVLVEAISLNLAKRKSADKVIARLKNKSKPVEALVNCAGFVLHVPSASANPADLAAGEAALQVMVNSVLLFSSVAASEMKHRGKGMIINVASTTAWAYTGNYSAIKRWVVSYTEGLAIELKGSGVTATAVCPGWAHTSFHSSGGRPEPKVPEWLFTDPAVIAQQGLRDALSGKILSIPTLRWRIILWVAMHGPLALARGFSRKYINSRGSQ